MSTIPPKSPASKLREMLIEPGKIVVAPGVFDGLSARIALSYGFDALYMTGAGTSMSKLGWADLGLATMNDMSSNAEMIASLDPAVPLIADADTGYGGPIMVSRTVEKYIHAGVSALHLEDQVLAKRCGHLLGKQVVDREVWYARLRAAVNARRKMGSDIVIIARTDARQQLGLEEVVERLKGAVEIGVDVVFPEALPSKEEARRICEAMAPVPVLLNMVTNGITPEMSVEEVRDIGFKIIIFPGAALKGAISGMQGSIENLKQEGRQSATAGYPGAKEAFMLCGLAECIDIDRRAGGKAFDSV